MAMDDYGEAEARTGSRRHGRGLVEEELVDSRPGGGPDGPAGRDDGERHQL
ncbi:hypothetical protein Scep_007333 [Stephania cephalantha]|uniref:Uncharacterized protein n=1 Tax=Stephania cephalantha TaxID=152367 RepID=A0AAP0K9S6_9MAGN